MGETVSVPTNKRAFLSHVQIKNGETAQQQSRRLENGLVVGKRMGTAIALTRVSPVGVQNLLKSLHLDHVTESRLASVRSPKHSNDHAWKELPQPQLFTALGFSKVNPCFSRLSYQSTVVPSRYKALFLSTTTATP